MIFGISAMINGCNQEIATEVANNEIKSADVEETAVVEDVSIEADADEEDVEVVTETVVESTEKVIGPQSAKEWSESLDTTVPVMTIWNDTLKEGIILEEGQKYVLRQDDLLVFLY